MVNNVYMLAEGGFWHTLKEIIRGDVGVGEALGGWISNLFDGFIQFCSDKLGDLVSTIGVGLELFAVIGIIIGVFCLIFHCTKLLRWSGISYFLAIILQLIGLIM